jgi:hypothetical protein
MKLFSLFLIPMTIVLTLLACTPSEQSVSSGGGETSPVLVVDSFVHEFYEGHVTNLSAFLDKYTDWPDFGPGDSRKIARSLSIRPLTKTEKIATVEVKFKVVGEESLGKFELHEHDDVQVYNLERRQNSWRIVEPIHMPYVSVAAAEKSLRTAIDFASSRIDQRNFTAVETEEYFRNLLENAKVSMASMERYR